MFNKYKYYLVENLVKLLFNNINNIYQGHLLVFNRFNRK